jgi:flagellar protein FlaG
VNSIVNIPSPNAAAPPATGRPVARQSGKDLPADGQKLPESPAPAPTPERVAQAVQQIQSFLNSSQRQLQFQVDQGSGRTVVRVINPETKELIRQIPSEEVLKLAQAIGAQGGQIISDLV